MPSPSPVWSEKYWLRLVYLCRAEPISSDIFPCRICQIHTKFVLKHIFTNSFIQVLLLGKVGKWKYDHAKELKSPTEYLLSRSVDKCSARTLEHPVCPNTPIFLLSVHISKNGENKMQNMEKKFGYWFFPQSVLGV